MRRRGRFWLVCCALIGLVGCTPAPWPTPAPVVARSPGPAAAKATPAASATPARAAFSGQLVREMAHDGDTDQFLMFSPDGRFIASWLPQGITVFEVATGKSAGKLAKGHEPLAFSVDGKTLYTAGNKVLESWTCPGLKPGEVRKSLKEGQAAADGSWSLQRLANGKLVLAGDRGRFAAWPPTVAEYSNQYAGYYCRKNSLLAASGAQDALLIDLTKNDDPWRSENVGRDVPAVALSEDGKLLVFGSMGGSIFVVDTERKEIVNRTGVPGEIRSLVLGRDGRTVAVGCGDMLEVVTVVDVAESKLLGTVDSGYTWALDISNDGKLLATGGEDGMLKIWRL